MYNHNHIKYYNYKSLHHLDIFFLFWQYHALVFRTPGASNFGWQIKCISLTASSRAQISSTLSRLASGRDRRSLISVIRLRPLESSTTGPRSVHKIASRTSLKRVKKFNQIVPDYEHFLFHIVCWQFHFVFIIFYFYFLTDTEDFTSATALVLVNAVYFKANWAEVFPEFYTKPRPFHYDGKNVKDLVTMWNFGIYKHGELPEVKAKFVELPYKVATLSSLTNPCEAWFFS